MKKHASFLIGLCAILFSAATKAQTTGARNAGWVSDKGYWVVESNRQTPQNAIVYFYNNDDMLVYKEIITGHKLKLNKKKTLYRLKAALEEAVSNSEKGIWASNSHLVMQHLKE